MRRTFTHTHKKNKANPIYHMHKKYSCRVEWLSIFVPIFHSRFVSCDFDFCATSIYIFSLSLYRYCSHFFIPFFSLFFSFVRPSFYATFPPHQHFSIRTHTHTPTHTRSYTNHWLSSRVYDIDDNAIRQYKMRFYFRSPETRIFASFWKGNKFASQSKIKFQENNIWMVARKRIAYASCVLWV